ncbi:MAG: hypothetical protein ACOCSE_06380, partial [Chitinivibrionales bacterium]
MKKIYFLLTAIPIILTACSDSSSPTGTQEEDEGIEYSTSQKGNILVVDSISVPDTITENSEITLYYTLPEQCISPEFSSSFEETPTQDSLYIEILYSLTEELTCPTEENHSIKPFSDKVKPDSGAVSCIITYCDSISEDTISVSSD